MRRILIVVVTVFLVAAGAGYFYFSGREYEFRFSEQQIREKLSDRLPIKKTYLIVLEVTLDNPRVALAEGSSRINAGLDVTLNIKLKTESKRLGGTIDATGGIRYDDQTGQFFVTDPVIDNLDVQGIPMKLVEKTNKVLTLALTEYFSTRPIYTLDRSDFKQAITALVLTNVVVKDKELIVTLGF